MAQQPVPVPGAAARALHPRGDRAARGAGTAPVQHVHGHRPASRRELRALPDLRRVPVPAGREVRRRDLRARPRAGRRQRAAPDRRPGALGRARAGRPGGAAAGRGRRGAAGGGRRDVRPVRGGRQLGRTAAGQPIRALPDGRSPTPADCSAATTWCTTTRTSRRSTPAPQRRRVPEDDGGQRLLRRPRRRFPRRGDAAHRQGPGLHDEVVCDAHAARRCWTASRTAASSGS